MSAKESARVPDLHTDHNVYIVGAGLSATVGLPVMSDFLRRMRECVSWLREHQREREFEAVAEVLRFRQRAAAAAYRARVDVDNVEELFSLASASSGATLSETMALAISATIEFCSQNQPRRAYVRVEDSKSPPAADWVWDEERPMEVGRRLKATVPEMLAAMFGGFMSEPPGRNTVITFNYDTLLEGGLKKVSVPFDYCLATDERGGSTPGAAAAEAALPLLKLHGSVNWTAAKDGVDVHPSYAEVRDSGGVPLLVPPTWRKTFGSHLAPVWDAAVTAIRSASRIIIVGFSMPTTDVHFKYLLAAGLSENISLTGLWLIDPDYKAVAERLQRILQPSYLERYPPLGPGLSYYLEEPHPGAGWLLGWPGMDSVGRKPVDWARYATVDRYQPLNSA